MAFSKRNHNQSTGIKSTTQSVFGLNDIMQRMISKLPPDPLKIKKPSTKKLNVILTDEQVIECRTRYEFEGWSKKKLLAEYSQYGVSENYLYSLLTYNTRSKLVPKNHKKL